MPSLTIVTRDGTERDRRGPRRLERDGEYPRQRLRRAARACAAAAAPARPATSMSIRTGSTRLAPRGADEDDLLDTSDHKIETSRLSCQILFSDATRRPAGADRAGGL